MTHDNSEALFGVRLWGVTIVVRQGEESRDDAFFPHSVRLKSAKNSGFDQMVDFQTVQKMVKGFVLGLKKKV